MNNQRNTSPGPRSIPALSGTMIDCKKCEAPLPKEANFCWNCGRPQRAVVAAPTPVPWVMIILSIMLIGWALFSITNAFLTAPPPSPTPAPTATVSVTATTEPPRQVQIDINLP